MVETTGTMLWAVTVNGKYIGTCPIDANFGLETATAYIKKAIKDKVITKADTEWPHLTTYKVVPEGHTEPIKIIKKARKTVSKVKKVGKKVSKK